MNYHAFTPDSGTTELAYYRRGLPLAEQATEPVPFPWSQPVITRYHRTPLWRRLLNSPAADHLRASSRAAFLPAVFGAVFLITHYLQIAAPLTGGNW